MKNKRKKLHGKGDRKMKKTSLNRNWEFMEGEPSSIPGMQRETKIVHLPHDFMIEKVWTQLQRAAARWDITTEEQELMSNGYLFQEKSFAM